MVTIAYRRGLDDMKASAYERELAQTNGVTIRPWAQPIALEGHDGAVSGVRVRAHAAGRAASWSATARRSGWRPTSCSPPSARRARAARSAQTPPKMQGGKIVVDEQRRTSLPKVWAGGDCVSGGLDLTVAAVEDGKRAAQIDHRGVAGLTGGRHG